jgi:hypothetical protein
MLLFKKLVDETQMPKPQKYTDIFILTKKLFVVSLRSLQYIKSGRKTLYNNFLICTFMSEHNTE